MTEIARYTFHVQSGKRSAGTNTDLILNTKEPISIKAKNGHFHIEVHHVNIPFSFYQLSSDIASLTCVFTDATGHPKTATITLTTGNYTTISVLAELSSKLIAMAQISSGAYTGFTPILNFTYSTTTSKSTFQMTSPVNASIQMNFSTNTNLGLFFGLASNTTISTALTATSTKVAIANPVNYLLVRSGSFQQNFNREYIVETDVYSDVLYRCPVGTSQNTWIQHYLQGEPVFVSNNYITTMNFYLSTNLTYTPIDLQGAEWAFSFSIVEMVDAPFESISSNMLQNFIITPTVSTNPLTEEERVKLEQERQDNLDKLAQYKNRLEQRQLK